MKKIIITILLASVIVPFSVFAADNMQEGADSYIDAVAAISRGDFLQAKVKFEEAAISLSGENQVSALRMADFFGRMTTRISQEELSLSDQWITIGEVKESDRFWHLYQFQTYGASILRLAMDGEVPLDEMVAAMGSDLFTKKQVIKNREGYVSVPNTSVPEVMTRIRMWYCDKDDTTNIIYEIDGYSKNAPDPVAEIVERHMGELDLSFSNVKCSREFPMWLLITIILVVLVGIIYWKKDVLKGKFTSFSAPSISSSENKAVWFDKFKKISVILSAFICFTLFGNSVFLLVLSLLKYGFTIIALLLINSVSIIVFAFLSSLIIKKSKMSKKMQCILMTASILVVILYSLLFTAGFFQPL